METSDKTITVINGPFVIAASLIVKDFSGRLGKTFQFIELPEEFNNGINLFLIST